MRQRFEGAFEGHYVGTPGSSALSCQFGAITPYEIRFYRGLVHDVALIPEPEAHDAGDDGSRSGAVDPEASQSDDRQSDPPQASNGSDAQPNDSPGAAASDDHAAAAVATRDPNVFYQGSIEDGRIVAPGQRIRFDGPLTDVEIYDFDVTHTAKRQHKVYGRVIGRIRGSFELPPEPEVPSAREITEALSAEEMAPPLSAEPSAAATPPTPDTPDAAAAIFDTAIQPPPDTSPTSTPVPGAPTGDATLPDPLPDPAHGPLLLLTAAVAIGLGLAAGATMALLWLLFLIPTLTMRWVLGGLFENSLRLRVFGAVLVFAQVLWLSVLFDWWNPGTEVLHRGVVIGLVLGVFISGLLPASLPLVLNGAALAIALFGWGSRFEANYAEKLLRDRGPSHAPPSVEHPGVPRTNDDGSWPRRPPRTLPAQPR